MLQAGRDLAAIGSITGHTDESLILHYGHASTESKDQAMEVLEKFAGNETLGLDLVTISKDALIVTNTKILPKTATITFPQRPKIVPFVLRSERMGTIRLPRNNRHSSKSSSAPFCVVGLAEKENQDVVAGWEDVWLYVKVSR
jgi:hypothetical protein